MQWWNLKLLNSKSARTRRQAVEKLGPAPDLGVIEALAPMLADPDPNVRKATARVLGESREESAVRALIHALRDAEREVRAEVVQALGKTGSPLAPGPLEDQLRDDDGTVRKQAVLALEALGWVPATDAQRVNRFVALGQLVKAAGAGPAAIEPLMNVLKRGTHYERQSAVDALRPQSRAGYERAGFTVRSVPLDEIEKAGGSLRCCVGEIY